MGASRELGLQVEEPRQQLPRKRKLKVTNLATQTLDQTFHWWDQVLLCLLVW